MILVGQSLEVLRHLERFTSRNEQCEMTSSSYEELVKNLNIKIDELGKKMEEVTSESEIKKKQKSIFTMKNINFLPLNRMRESKGDGPDVFSQLAKEEEEEGMKREDKKTKENDKIESIESSRSKNDCFDFIQSTIGNEFFKEAFYNIGLEHEMKRLEGSKINGEKYESCSLYVIK